MEEVYLGAIVNVGFYWNRAISEWSRDGVGGYGRVGGSSVVLVL